MLNVLKVIQLSGKHKTSRKEFHSVGNKCEMLSEYGLVKIMVCLCPFIVLPLHTLYTL